MNKRVLYLITAAVLFAGFLAWKNLPVTFPYLSSGKTPNISNNSSATSTNETGLPLKIPEGFKISTFAKNLPGARVLVFDSFGNGWVSRPSAGIVSTLEIKDGKVGNQHDVFRNLKNPHGLALEPDRLGLLYIAEENKIRRVTLYSDDPGEDVASLPAGGRHTTRTIAFGPDEKLYITIGSSCDVCLENDARRASMLRYDPKTKQVETFATGLRNTVFFAWDKAGKLFGADMGRDWLGDDLPPDEINIIEKGKNYGWPICYGKNIHDTDFDKNTYIRNPCMEPFEIPSHIDIPAHSAPLGLAFVPEGAGWPKEYENNLLVAYHGSWNRSKSTGYKVVRFKLGSNGNYSGEEDFITGWLSGNDVLGRPAGLTFKDGILYLTDDKAGVIYSVSPKIPAR